MSWWGNAHHDRPGGVRNASATAWVPGAKPFWFTELGCGAVDKGANQPNLFTDPKSSEDGRPYFSNATPDSLAQRQVLRAAAAYWDNGAHNPTSGVYGGRMLERTYLWTWDARPYPAFPADLDVWRDGTNYPTGHWLTGRVGGMASDELARAVAADFGVTLDAVEAQQPFVLGYVVDRAMTARDALAPLLEASGLEVHDTPEGLRLARASARQSLTIDDVVAGDGAMISRRRPDPGEAVGQVALSYYDRERDYQSGSVIAIAPTGGALETRSTGLVLDAGSARATAERTLLERTAQRDVLALELPPSLAAIEPGDAIELDGAVFEVTEIREGMARRISARAVPPALAVTTAGGRSGSGGTGPTPRSEPVLDAVHLPAATDDVSRTRLALGAFARPWPGEVSVTEDASGTSVAQLSRAATLGELTAALAAGGIYRWDTRNAVELVLYSGHLSSADDDLVLAGGNRIAVETDAGDWEVIGFADAALIAPQTYRLTRLLRGQWGTDAAIGAAGIGNRAMLLDSRPTLVAVSPAWLGASVDLRSYAGAADAVGTVSTVALDLTPALPLAPVHLEGVRGATGDVTLRWGRRSRADSDSWAPDDAPLDYSPEAYRVTIYNGVTAVRTIDGSSPSASYSAAQQTADFGSLPASFSFTVAQRSALYGPGPAATGTFHA